MNTNDLLRSVADSNTIIILDKYSYPKWTCLIKRKSDGVQLEVSCEADEPGEAVERAVTKFQDACRYGTPELMPALEYTPPSQLTMPDDTIPF